VAGLGLAAGVILLAGCSHTPEVTSYTNPVSGKRTDVLAENLLDAPGNDREMVWLNAYRDFTDATAYKYYLEVIYGARQDVGYLDIVLGRSLTIVADGEEMRIAGLGSLSKKQEKGAVFETAHYEVTGAEITRIARAKNVTVRVAGTRGAVVRQFAPENSEKFRRFMEKSGADL